MNNHSERDHVHRRWLQQPFDQESFDGGATSSERQDSFPHSSETLLPLQKHGTVTWSASLSSFSWRGRCDHNNHEQKQNDLRQEGASEEEGDEVPPPLDQITITTFNNSLQNEQQLLDDEDSHQQQQEPKKWKQPKQDEEHQLSHDEDSSFSGGCSSISAEDDDEGEDSKGHPQHDSCYSRTMTTRPATRLLPSFPCSGDDPSESFSSPRSIFPDYWKAYGVELRTCPSGWQKRKEHSQHPKLLVPTPTLSSYAFSLSSRDGNNMNKSPQSLIPRPRETGSTSTSSQRQLRRSIFGGAANASARTVPALSSSLLWQQQPLHQRQAAAAAIDPITKIAQEETEPAPGLRLLSSSCSSSCSSATTARSSHPIYELGKDAVTMRILPKTSRTDSPVLSRRPSALRRTGRYNTIGSCCGSTCSSVGSVGSGTTTTTCTKSTNTLSVTFKEKVDIAEVPASWSVWTVNYAAEGWSDWFT